MDELKDSILKLKESVDLNSNEKEIKYVNTKQEALKSKLRQTSTSLKGSEKVRNMKKKKKRLMYIKLKIENKN